MTPAAPEAVISRRAADYGHRLGREGGASGGCGRELAWAASWLRAGLAAEQEAGPHALFGCGPALAWHQWGWWVRSAGGGECGGEGILVCVVWRVELVGADVGPQR